MEQVPVIILDNDNVTSTLLRAMLSEISSKVTVAYTVPEAIILAQNTPSVIIIRNSFQKHGSILQTVREIEIESPNSEFVLVTSNKDEEAEADAIEAGFADIIVMPFVKKLITARISRVLRNIKSIKTLTSQACEDTLTGLYNRRELEVVLPDEIRKAIRNNDDLSYLMLDVDFFKPFNDTYGHLMGDRVLSLVGQVLTDALRRPGDKAFRYGGEEFAIILPGTNTDGALCIAKKIMEGVKRLAIPHSGSLISDIVTVSIGISANRFYTEYPYDDSLKTSIIESADRTLYRAKRSGRNRAEITETDYTDNKILLAQGEL